MGYDVDSVGGPAGRRGAAATGAHQVSPQRFRSPPSSSHRPPQLQPSVAPQPFVVAAAAPRGPAAAVYGASYSDFPSQSQRVTYVDPTPPTAAVGGASMTLSAAGAPSPTPSLHQSLSGANAADASFASSTGAGVMAGRFAQRYVPTPRTFAAIVGNGVNANNMSVVSSRCDDDDLEPSFVGATSPTRVGAQRAQQAAMAAMLDMGAASPAPALEEPPAGRKTPHRGSYQPRHVSPRRRNASRSPLRVFPDELSPVMVGASPVGRPSGGESTLRRIMQSPRTPASTRNNAAVPPDVARGNSPTQRSTIVEALQRRVATLETERLNLTLEFEAYRARNEALLGMFEREITALRAEVAENKRATPASSSQQAPTLPPAAVPPPSNSSNKKATRLQESASTGGLVQGDSDAVMLELLRQERDSALRENIVLRDQIALWRNGINPNSSGPNSSGPNSSGPNSSGPTAAAATLVVGSSAATTAADRGRLTPAVARNYTMGNSSSSAAVVPKSATTAATVALLQAIDGELARGRVASPSGALRSPERQHHGIASARVASPPQRGGSTLSVEEDLQRRLAERSKRFHAA